MTSPTAPVSTNRRAAIVGLLASSVGLSLLSAAALWSARGQRWEHTMWFSTAIHRRVPLTDLMVVGRVPIALLAGLVAVCLAAAVLRRHWFAVFAAIIVLIGANVTTQVLKHHLLLRSDFDLGTVNSLPSGHTTMAFGLTAAAVIAAPVAVRSVVALVGAAGTTITGAVTIIAGWHRPSDVVAAAFVVLIWVALVALAGRRGPSPSRHWLFATCGAALSIGVLCLWSMRSLGDVSLLVQGCAVMATAAAVIAAATTAVCRLAPSDHP